MDKEKLCVAAPCFRFHVVGTAVSGYVTVATFEEAKKVLSCISIGALTQSEFKHVYTPNKIQIDNEPFEKVIQITQVEEII